MNDIEKAIEYLKEPIGKSLTEHNEAINLAISALEKQIPKKPIHHGETYKEYEHDKCPVCDYVFNVVKRTVNEIEEPEYCRKCGQKLDW